MRVVALSRPDAAAEALAAVDAMLAAARPGHRIGFIRHATALPPARPARLAFVHADHGTAHARVGASRMAIGLGDVVVLRSGDSLELDAPLSFVVLELPEPFAADAPSFLCPDRDPRLTDRPGGCATAHDAYRRILLTWLPTNGPYTCRAVNCHRVCMTDSFSHYHPLDGGFEELYLVHDVRPGAGLHWSPDVSRIEAPALVDRATARTLVRHTPLAAGDLVFIPRGTMHRAVGGVLAHVVTIPGFVPAREIGLDHHLRAIGERLGLVGDEALPYQLAASSGPVVK